MSTPTPSTIPSGPFAIGDDLARHPARRHRSTGVPPSPLHVHGGADDLDRPTVTRLAEAAALTPSGDPLLDDAVIVVAEGLDGLDGPSRLHRARNIVQGLMLVLHAFEQRGAGGKLARDASATTTVMRADLYPPVIDGGRWALYRGGLGRLNAKTEMYRRDDRDGTFTAAP